MWAASEKAWIRYHMRSTYVSGLSSPGQGDVAVMRTLQVPAKIFGNTRETWPGNPCPTLQQRQRHASSL
ncbi:hypothetical protein C8R48DRAFT_682356 [Suillus tomentosus]|nr:hypothetical protein C8R48DRAFT_682356 [Suillus tomentosus]